MTEKVPCIKGAALRPFVKYYADRYGRARAATVVARIDPGLAYFDMLDASFGMIATSWYPVSMIRRLVDGLLEGISDEERLELTKGGARAVMQATVHGVYKFLFETMMSPDRYARKAQALFSRYHDSGVMTKEPFPGGHRSTITDWSGHHRFFCDLIIYTGFFVYEAMGLKDVDHKRTACVDDGAPACTFVATWKQ